MTDAIRTVDEMREAAAQEVSVFRRHWLAVSQRVGKPLDEAHAAGRITAALLDAETSIRALPIAPAPDREALVDDLILAVLSADDTPSQRRAVIAALDAAGALR